MSIIQLKYLELLSVEQENEQSILHTRLTFDETTDFRWAIDEETAENLKTAINAEDGFKYRLSLSYNWSESKRQYSSFLNRTFRSQSEKVYFNCSEQYVNYINEIKQIQHPHEVERISTLLPSEELEPTIEEVEVIDEVKDVEEVKTHQKPFANKFSKAIITIAAAFILTIIGFSFSDSPFFQKPAMSDKIVASASSKDAVSVEQNTTDEPIELPELEQPDSIGGDADSKLPVHTIDESIIYNLPKGSVALTFDDGPSIYSEKIVDILNDYEVGATFFYIGVNVQEHPDIVKMVSSNGFSIGSHSMYHKNLATLNSENQENEMMRVNHLIEEIIDEPVILSRPPYGSWNDHTKKIAEKHQQKLVFWNSDPEDWKSNSSDKIFNYVKRSDASGSIILLHETQAVVDALPRIIEYLQAQNLEIVNLQ